MSQTATPQGDEPDTEVNKTLTVVGYVINNAEVSPRHWADSYDQERDYWSRYRREYEDTTYYLRGEHFEEELEEEEYKELLGIDTGDLKVERQVEKDVREGYDYDPKKAAKTLKNEIFNEILEPIGPLFEVQPTAWTLLKKDDEGVCKVYSYCEEMPMLKDHGEVSEENPYVDPDKELTVVKYRFRIQGVTEDELEVINEQVLGPFMAALGRHKQIKTIRMLDCEQKTTEKGVCLNI